MLAAYGQRRKTEAERPKHHLIGGNQHVVALYNRVSGELMVLGFVAFVVWVLELPSDSQSDSRAESLASLILASLAVLSVPALASLSALSCVCCECLLPSLCSRQLFCIYICVSSI